MFSKLWANELSPDYVTDTPINNEYFISIRKINFLVGANNTGKSRFLRKLAGAQRYSYYTDTKHYLPTIKTKTALIEPVLDQDVFFRLEVVDPLLSDTTIQTEIFRHKLNEYNTEIQASEEAMKPNDPLIKRLIKNLVSEQSLNYNELYINFDITRPDYEYYKYYIPTHRTLQPNTSKDLLAEAIQKEFFASVPCPAIITGHDLYERINALKNSPDDQSREVIHQYEQLLSEAFFDNQALELIASYHQTFISIKLGHERTYPISQLGNGIQHLIILTLYAYLEDKPSSFFIEEPETNLHSELVIKLIGFLIEHTPHQYFMTTHAGYLIDYYKTHEQVTSHHFTKNLNAGKTVFTLRDAD